MDTYDEEAEWLEEMEMEMEMAMDAGATTSDASSTGGKENIDTTVSHNDATKSIEESWSKPYSSTVPASETSATSVAPVAPIAPIAPVAFVAPTAPTTDFRNAKFKEDTKIENSTAINSSLSATQRLALSMQAERNAALGGGVGVGSTASGSGNEASFGGSAPISDSLETRAASKAPMLSGASRKKYVLDQESQLATLQALFQPCADDELRKYIHERPPSILLSAAPEVPAPEVVTAAAAAAAEGNTTGVKQTPDTACAQQPRPCAEPEPEPLTSASVTSVSVTAQPQAYTPLLLHSGHRMYLYRRRRHCRHPTTSTPSSSSAAAAAAAAGGGSGRGSGSGSGIPSLLAQPMHELMQEADRLKAQAMLRREEMRTARELRAQAEAEAATIAIASAAMGAETARVRIDGTELNLEAEVAEEAEEAEGGGGMETRHDSNNNDDNGAVNNNKQSLTGKDGKTADRSAVAGSSGARRSGAGAGGGGGGGGGGELWVDKYSPKSFTQLLSPEKINREVLRALKKWDAFVFKHHLPHPSTTVTNTTTTSSSSSSSSSGGGGGVGTSTSAATANRVVGEVGGEISGSTGGDTRPHYKVILLCGPPGTGKTTLAHIAAHHCGYLPVEVNASDDRSPEKLRQLIANATQNSTLDGEHRPNCVILDEIDGIDGSRSAIDVLLNIIKAPLPAASQNNTSETGSNATATKGRKTSSGGGSTVALTRPLICICNDQYAPALREITKLAQIFVFSPPKELRLIQRLRQVCKEEGLLSNNSSSSFLTALCSATGYDIRASINNLQFAALKSIHQLRTEAHLQEQAMQRTTLSSRGFEGGSPSGKWNASFLKQTNSKPANSTSTSSAATTATARSDMDIGQILRHMIQAGLKDENLSLSQVYHQIFTEITSETNDSMSQHGSSGSGSGVVMSNVTASATKSARAGLDPLCTAWSWPQKKFSTHAMQVMDTMQYFGDTQQVISGIHENVHRVHLHTNFNKHVLMTEWLSYTEDVGASMLQARDGFQLLPYVSTIAAAVHCYCAVPKRSIRRIEWPKRDREMHFKLVQKQNIVQSLLEGRSVHALQISKQRLILDVLSSLLDIISPVTVRALPFITLSKPEQAAIMNVVTVMESCGLHYTPSKVLHSANTTTASGYQPYHQQQQRTTLALDPAVEQLVTYTDPDVLLEEILTSAGAGGSSMIQKPKADTWNNMNYSGSVHGKNRANNNSCDDDLALRHSYPSPELRQLISTEQRKYAIQLKVQQQQQQATQENDDQAPTTAGRDKAPTTAVASASTARTGDLDASGASASAPYRIMFEQQRQKAEKLQRKQPTSAAGTAAAAAVDGVHQKRSFAGGGLGGFFKRVPTATAAAADSAMSKRAKTTATSTAADAVSSATVSPTAAATNAVNRVRFKFNQGFSNAVRRTVTIDEFL